MNLFLFTVLLATGADTARGEGKAMAAPQVEGKWLVVYAEEGGRHKDTWAQQIATVDGRTLSFEQGGKKHELQLNFQPGQKLQATVEGKKENGVYVAGQDYLCISLNGDKKSRRNSSGSFILILRRQRQ